MGVTIAYKTLGALGVLKDEPVPDKWDLTERDETTTEDLPEIRFVPMILLFSSYTAQYHKIHIEISS